jgi:all-trans-retinol 13,14-reductase
MNISEQKERDFKYDYLIVGSGSAALTVGALLVNAGKRVCMLEAHDIPGGYAQSFKWGDFYFCGQVHYIWGCAPGGMIYEFLKKLGLEKDITFELHDGDSYDRMSMPDGKIVGIPYGYEKLAQSINEAYPGQAEVVQKFTTILQKIADELRAFPDRKIRWWEYVTEGWKFPMLLKYRNKTVQDVFDEAGLSKEAQLVLIANAGDMMEPPERLSIFAYVGLFGGYNTGAYYPTKHFKYYVERLARFITDHRGSNIFYKHEVVKIHTEGDRVTSVETKNGRTFTARTIICNIDPKKATTLIDASDRQQKMEKALTYKYSPSGVMIYLGLKGIDLRKHGFGAWNHWHCLGDDMNQMWREMATGDFTKPWVFISTPTLHTLERGTVAPADCDIMEIAAYTEYQWLEDLRKKDYKEYEKEKMRIADRMLDIVEERFLPELRKHIVTKVVGTASSNEYWAWAPQGNAYGATFTPDQVGPKRPKAETQWKNFFFCNATAGYGGIHGTVSTGVDLYRDLTGDGSVNEANFMRPKDDERAAMAYKEAARVKAERGW